MSDDQNLAINCCAVVFCGGPAIRLQPILQGKPKALVELNESPYIVGLLRNLKGAGVRECVLCVSRLTLRIVHAVGDGTTLGLHVRYAIDDGTVENAGALWNALPPLEAPLLVCINGDTVVDVDLVRLLRAHRYWMPAVTLVGSTRDDQPHPGAIEVALDGWVRAIREDDQDRGMIITRHPGRRYLANSGIYVVDRKRLSVDWPVELRRGKLEQGILKYLAGKGCVWAYDNGERFLLDIGVPERLERAKQRLADIARFFRV